MAMELTLSNAWLWRVVVGGGEKRGIDTQLATAETALSFHHYIPTRNRTKNKQAVLSYMGKNITKNENPHEPTSWR
jgi:hypothetical protein